MLLGCNLGKPLYEKLNTTPPAGISEWHIEQTSTPQTVLFVFPHPDDEIICAGTIAKMKQAGWSVNLLTLTQGLDIQDKTVRKAEWIAAGMVMGYDNMQIHDFLNNSWEAILGDSIRFWNTAQDTLKAVIKQHIEFIHPDIVITYDDIIGGYGHPEHQISAKLTHELFDEYQTTPPFDNLQLFQFTLTPEFEHFLLSNVTTYQKAKALTASTSMLPAPTTYVDIFDTWPKKKAAGNCYASQKSILQKFYLLPLNADTASHYQTFNMEFFNEVKR